MKSPLLTVTTAVLAVASSASAQVIYESFNYSVGNNTLNGAAATGTGLTGNWTYNQNGDAAASTLDIASGSITPRNLQTANNQLVYDAPGVGGSANSFAYAAMTSGASTALQAGATSTTIWMSYAITFSGAGTPTVALRNNAAGATGGIVFGLDSAGSAVNLYANNGIQATGSFTFTAGQEYFLVANLTYSINAGTTTFESGNAWVLNDVGSLPVNEAGLGTAIASFTTDVTSGANRVPTFVRIDNRSSTGDNAFDEIRVGTSFSEVVVVPEPTTWALLAGGLTTAMILRRRRTA